MFKGCVVANQKYFVFNCEVGIRSKHIGLIWVSDFKIVHTVGIMLFVTDYRLAIFDSFVNRFAYFDIFAVLYFLNINFFFVS